MCGFPQCFRGGRLAIMSAITRHLRRATDRRDFALPTQKPRRLLPAALALAVVVSGVGVAGTANARPAAGGTAVDQPARTSVVGTAADGAELLRGVFFMQGEIGRKLEKLPYISMDPDHLRKNRTPESVNGVRRLIDRAEAARPGLLASFSSRMRSGDPYQVEAALTDAGAALRQVMPDQPTTTGQNDEMAESVSTAVHIHNVGAGVVALAVFVAIAAVLVLVAFINTPSEPPTLRSLESERLMANFATELRAI